MSDRSAALTLEGGADQAARRVARSAASVAAVRTELSAWLEKRRSDPRFARFQRHFDVLDVVLTRMLDSVDKALPMAAGRPASAYDECRAVDQSLLLIQRTFRWYAEKYDQRLDDQLTDVLRSADEIVRSCWTEPFIGLHTTPPNGPLPYLDARFDAFATPRVSPPPDLRAPADAVVAELVGDLPVPTIALPELATREPWWLVLAAHETGHHVHKDLLPTLEAETRALLTSVTGELADVWSGLALEVFADAYSVLMVGGAAAWPVRELQLTHPTGLCKPPVAGDRYPPPAVRLALIGELVTRAGLQGAGAPITAADVAAWVAALPGEVVAPVARTTVERHLGVVPAVADALLSMPVGGRPLHELSGVQTDWFASGARVDVWARRLRSGDAVLSPVSTRPAARLAVAAAVAALPGDTDSDADPGGGASARIREALLKVLPTCGGPGVLAAAPAADLDDLADRLAARLLQAGKETVMQPGAEPS